MNASKRKKKLLKNLNFRISKKKIDDFSALEFLERFMIGSFLIRLGQFEKTGLKG